jgi:ribosome biogenesis GTPase A
MDKEKNIHWFPGHMKKAMRQIEERLKIVDLVVELVDARAPRSSRNPYLGQLIKGKKHLLVITKDDLADEEVSKLWLSKLKEETDNVILGDLNNKVFINEIKSKITAICKENSTNNVQKQFKGITPKVMIIGIPNIGKSTLINRLVGRGATKVANKPGLTRGQQLINVDNEFILIDTPGILPPNYDDKDAVKNLALLGTIRLDILPQNELSTYLAEFLLQNYPQNLKKRFNISEEMTDVETLFPLIGEKRGILKSQADYLDRVQILLLTEFRNGLIGRISLEKPNDK